MTDRRRVSGPSGDTAPPTFLESYPAVASPKQTRTREPNQIRKIFLKTGLTPSASGSAYLEVEPSTGTPSCPGHLSNRPSALKLTCTVYGPRPLPRSAPFTPQLLLSTHIKFAPFASRQRRGYVRDASERDLAVHLESALRGILLSERWPKSGLDVVITVLEGDKDYPQGDSTSQIGGRRDQNQELGLMSILSGCITVASAAIADAGIDCIDLITGGMAATIRHPTRNEPKAKTEVRLHQTEGAGPILLDPCSAESDDLGSVCVLGYLQSRDEVTEIWVKGRTLDSEDHTAQNHAELNSLIDRAVEAAMAARLVVVEALKESTAIKLKQNSLLKD